MGPRELCLLASSRSLSMSQPHVIPYLEESPIPPGFLSEADYGEGSMIVDGVRKFFGVSIPKNRAKYIIARVKGVNLGRYPTAEDAAVAVDAAQSIIPPEHSVKLNFKPERFKELYKIWGPKFGHNAALQSAMKTLRARFLGETAATEAGSSPTATAAAVASSKLGTKRGRGPELPKLNTESDVVDVLAWYGITPPPIDMGYKTSDRFAGVHMRRGKFIAMIEGQQVAQEATPLEAALARDVVLRQVDPSAALTFPTAETRAYAQLGAAWSTRIVQLFGDTLWVQSAMRALDADPNTEVLELLRSLKQDPVELLVRVHQRLASSGRLQMLLEQPQPKAPEAGPPPGYLQPAAPGALQAASVEQAAPAVTGTAAAVPASASVAPLKLPSGAASSSTARSSASAAAPTAMAAAAAAASSNDGGPAVRPSRVRKLSARAASAAEAKARRKKADSATPTAESVDGAATPAASPPVRAEKSAETKPSKQKSSSASHSGAASHASGGGGASAAVSAAAAGAAAVDDGLEPGNKAAKLLHGEQLARRARQLMSSTGALLSCDPPPFDWYAQQPERAYHLPNQPLPAKPLQPTVARRTREHLIATQLALGYDSLLRGRDLASTLAAWHSAAQEQQAQSSKSKSAPGAAPADAAAASPAASGGTPGAAPSPADALPIKLPPVQITMPPSELLATLPLPEELAAAADMPAPCLSHPALPSKQHVKARAVLGNSLLSQPLPWNPAGTPDTATARALSRRNRALSATGNPQVLMLDGIPLHGVTVEAWDAEKGMGSIRIAPRAGLAGSVGPDTQATLQARLQAHSAHMPSVLSKPLATPLNVRRDQRLGRPVVDVGPVQLVLPQGRHVAQVNGVGSKDTLTDLSVDTMSDPLTVAAVAKAMARVAAQRQADGKPGKQR